jgi:hypothetical protein
MDVVIGSNDRCRLDIGKEAVLEGMKYLAKVKRE